MQRNHEDLRKELWIEIAVAVASADNSTNKASCAAWADYVLNDFDERFKKEEKKNIPNH